jgi:hypothetical protein
VAVDPITTRLTKIRADAGGLLDRMNEAVPKARYDRTPPFADYMQRAQQRAAYDPQFADRLAQALQQYHAARQIRS